MKMVRFPLGMIKNRPVTRGGSGVRPNPPFHEPPSKNYEPPPPPRPQYFHLISDIVFQIGPLTSSVSTQIQHTEPSLEASIFRTTLQHSIRSSNLVESLEPSQKSQTHCCWRIVGIQALYIMMFLLK